MDHESYFSSSFMCYDVPNYNVILEKKILAAKDSFLSNSVVGPIIRSFKDDQYTIIPSLPKNFRQRCRFAIIADDTGNCCTKDTELVYAMWDGGCPSIRVENFPIASIQICSAMSFVIKFVSSMRCNSQGLKAIHFLSSSIGHLIITLIYDHPLSETEFVPFAINLQSFLVNQAIPEINCNEISIIGRSKGIKHIVGKDYVYEVLKLEDGRELLYKQIDGGFSNPNSFVNGKVLDWMCCILQRHVVGQCSENCPDLLEMYCGNANHTVAIAGYFRRVVAVELNKLLCIVAEENCHQNSILNALIVPCDSEKFASIILRNRTYIDKNHQGVLYSFGTVVVDPPRCGLDNRTRKMLESYEFIVYISCNPVALIRDLEELCVTHEILELGFFDHFAYTPHLESGVLLRRKKL